MKITLVTILLSIIILSGCDCPVFSSNDESGLKATTTVSQASFDLDKLEKGQKAENAADDCEIKDKNKIDLEANKPFKLQGNDGGCETK
ncbi:MAG: hypothetical protein A2504_16020 [Bdellovibrionales bacterium RIFOXYD12_FULL_39_22]|nr:MAG: hypothetical protein A2385_07930 [Bdellovibrionales bacterium RIFOXYB1_FULL_39_21]OFZ43012.1 MAG: hypothetical protein A2485_11295 [Bdellovibrionales bacterium RIFOXYC12_FULL_39_17]OFZ50902.1 MAG: hypothetical protein A2404_06845 [Bdellovibrionales bacterium RIFOXYC1_FULL_39_130]OFZ73637.1 MAG: hypothetical protein A2451_06380 [Bdellovibrionales bacterium RIFOXYC2_FULL_39_8]OFZ78125.1 MAG: hypothetical protein A2560_02015 [Bdellovibrionales bacterium RIFOXYD1_FULL_39_84]OFZ93993.1 MAG: